MTKKDKNLLLKALCAILPYDVIVGNIYGHKHKVAEINCNFGMMKLVGNNDEYFEASILTYKPYLRPMSSMTEEEKSWYESLRNALTYQENGEYDLDDFNELNDFLNRRKLDRYGLIEKGLALEAPEGMYND